MLRTFLNYSILSNIAPMSVGFRIVWKPKKVSKSLDKLVGLTISHYCQLFLVYRLFIMNQ